MKNIIVRDWIHAKYNESVNYFCLFSINDYPNPGWKGNPILYIQISKIYSDYVVVREGLPKKDFVKLHLSFQRLKKKIKNIPIDDMKRFIEKELEKLSYVLIEKDKLAQLELLF